MAIAADYPAPKQGDWIAKNFKSHTGETMPELKLHYTTVGAPTGQPVLHGSGGSVYLIPASTETRGHLTTGNAKFYAEQVKELLATAPQKTM